jgi:hypothetical protein
MLSSEIFSIFGSEFGDYWRYVEMMTQIRPGGEGRAAASGMRWKIIS